MQQVRAPYPNQQLRAVSLETFFRGSLGVPTRLELVQDRFREELPNLFVPNTHPGEAVALRPYQLRPDDGRESLALAMNQATYISFDYPGYDAFIMRAMQFLSEALRLLGIERLERVIYRYENEILIPQRDDGTLAVDKYFQIALPGGAPLESVTGLQFEWTRRWERGSFGGKSESLITAQASCSVAPCSLSPALAGRRNICERRQVSRMMRRCGALKR